MNEYPSEVIITRTAQQVWEYVYQEPWPEGWTVRWESAPTATWEGVCVWSQKLIKLNWSYLKDCGEEDPPLFTLVHEFTHVRHPRLCHGNEFRRLTLDTYFGRLMGDPLFAEEKRQEEREQLAQMRWTVRRLLAEQRRLNARLLALEARGGDLTSCEERQLPTSG